MKTRILVVDDDQLVADTLALIYKVNGYDSKACYTAAEGFACATTFLPQFLLCDFTMPDESGVDLACRLQEAFPDLRMLLLTAYSNHAAQAHARAHRLRRSIKVVSKPCRPDDLLRETQAALQAT